MRHLLLLTLTAACIAAASAGDGLAKGFIMAGGKSCAAACEAAGKKTAKFTEFNAANPAETAVCAVRASDKEGWVPGWQTVGDTACHVSLNLNATANSDSVACLCLDGGEVQGLDLPGSGKGCSKACGKSITGRKGRPIAASAGDKKAGYVCVPLSEIGVLSRFGHVHGDGYCRTDIQGSAVETSTFSCFCVFENDAEPGALAANAAAAKERQAKEGDAPAPGAAPRKAAL